MYGRSGRRTINNGYFTPVAASRIFALVHIIAVFLALGQLDRSAHALQTVQITNYNGSSLNGPSAYYRPMAAKSAADQAMPSGPSPVPPTNAHKLAISDLTRDLYVQLAAIEENEMLIPAIQSAFDSAEQTISDHNDTRTFNQMANKIEAKLATAMRVVGEKSQRILGVLLEPASQAERLYLDTIVLPSSPSASIGVPAKRPERRALDAQLAAGANGDDRINGTNASIAYAGTGDHGKPIEIWNFLKNADHLHQTNDKNFTTNRRLIEILKDVDFTLTHVPHFRDAFFIPSHSFAGNNNCRNKILCAHHRYMYASSVKWRNVIMVIDYGSTADDPHVLDATKAFGRC